MRITSNSIYNILRFYRGNDILWSIEGELTGDFVAGICVGIHTLMYHLVKTFNYRGDEWIEIITQEGSSINFIDLNRTDIILGEYIIVENISPELIFQYHTDLASYGWWISEPYYENKYTLYTYSTSSNDFIKGFINIFTAFNIDFRDYVLGTPFKYINKTIINYSIEGYDMVPFDMLFETPVSIESYYINNNEDDF
jgi:hypothetical protein